MSSQAHQLPAVMIREPGRAPLCLLVRGPAIEVGRDCRGLLLTDPQISRRHLALHEASGVVHVTDLGSTNGTRVDGDPIAGAHALAPGQVVQFGATTIVLFRGSTDTAALSSGAGEAGAARGQALTIVISDIDDATRRGIDLGATRWTSLLDLHNSIVRRHVDRYHVTEVRALGDGFLLSFPTALDALSCMVDVQRALDALARSRPADRLRVCVGVHTGDVVIAARVAAAARGGEILVSGLVRELVEPSGGFRFGPPRVARLVGSGEEHLLHPVAWEDVNMRGIT
ncbi:MAG: hypothetical protein JWL83_4570 [Actinomycetia bacterium]|nr:hypothetical protein [Actinomycetes bacterium]